MMKHVEKCQVYNNYEQSFLTFTIFRLCSEQHGYFKWETSTQAQTFDF